LLLRIAPPLQGTYAASKHAFEGYSDALRRELLHFGISVSIVEPAYVLSNLQATATAGSGASMYHGVTADKIKEDYSHLYNTSNSEAIVHNISLANPPDVTTTWAITVSPLVITCQYLCIPIAILCYSIVKLTYNYVPCVRVRLAGCYRQHATPHKVSSGEWNGHSHLDTSLRV
jgi:hypothetical protein